MPSRHEGGTGPHIPSAPRERHAVRVRDTHESSGFSQGPSSDVAEAAQTHEVVKDRIISGSQILEGSVTLDKLNLLDEWGSTVLTSQGFGDTWRRFITSGFWNSDFRVGPPRAGDQLDSVDNVLPYWPFTFASGTAINARILQDTATASLHVVRFDVAAGAAGDSGYIEQIVPIMGSLGKAWHYMFHTSWRVDSSSLLEVWVGITFLKEDGVTAIGSETIASSTFTTVWGFTNHISEQAIAAGTGGPPSDAYFVRLRAGVRRGAAANGVTGQAQLLEVWTWPGPAGMTLRESDDPDNYAHAKLSQHSGVLQLRADNLSTTGGVYVPQWLAVDKQLRKGGNAFPTTALLTGDTFFRKDLRQEFFYDGTRWLTTVLHHAQFGTDRSANAHLPVNATLGSASLIASPTLDGCSDIWIEEASVMFHVAGGGTALSGSHKWEGQLTKQQNNSATQTNIGSVISIAAGSSGQWRVDEQSIDALLNNGTSHVGWSIGWTKTGTPGDLYYAVTLKYRMVAT